MEWATQGPSHWWEEVTLKPTTWWKIVYMSFLIMNGRIGVSHVVPKKILFGVSFLYTSSFLANSPAQFTTNVATSL